MKKIIAVCIVLVFSGITTMAIAEKPDMMSLWHCGCVLDSLNEFGQSSSVSLKYSNLTVRGSGKGHGSIAPANGHDDPEECMYISDGTYATTGAVVYADFVREDVDYEATDLSDFVENCYATTTPACPQVGESCGYLDD